MQRERRKPSRLARVSFEVRPKLASQSFTRDWLTVRTVIHGFSHFNYAMLHHGALYSWLASTMPSSTVRLPFSPLFREISLSIPFLLAPFYLPRTRFCCSFSPFRQRFSRQPYLDLPFHGFRDSNPPKSSSERQPLLFPSSDRISACSSFSGPCPTCATALSRLQPSAHPTPAPSFSVFFGCAAAKGKRIFPPRKSPRTKRPISLATDAGNRAGSYWKILARKRVFARGNGTR